MHDHHSCRAPLCWLLASGSQRDARVRTLELGDDRRVRNMYLRVSSPWIAIPVKPLLYSQYLNESASCFVSTKTNVRVLLFSAESWWSGRRTWPSSSSSSSGWSVWSRWSTSIELKRRRGPADLVRGVDVAGEVELGCPAGHGPCPLLIRRLLRQIFRWRGTCAAWEEEGGPCRRSMAQVVSSRGAP